MEDFESLLSLPPQRRVRMVFSTEVKKQGAALLHQQCGLWGWDVRREIDGARKNLLLELGFERTPPPTGVLGATTYSKRDDNSGLEVILWGFGLYFGDGSGGIFLSRFMFHPLYSPLKITEHVWLPQPLRECFQAPRSAHECLTAFGYFLGAMNWIASYEQDIELKLGAEYRVGTLKSWELAGRDHQNYDGRNSPKQGSDIQSGVRNWTEMADLTQKDVRFNYRSKGKIRSIGWPCGQTNGLT